MKVWPDIDGLLLSTIPSDGAAVYQSTFGEWVVVTDSLAVLYRDPTDRGIGQPVWEVGHNGTDDGIIAAVKLMLAVA